MAVRLTVTSSRRCCLEERQCLRPPILVGMSAPLGCASERHDFFAHWMHEAVDGGGDVGWLDRMAGVLIAQVPIRPRVAMPLQSAAGDLSQLESRRQSVVLACDQKNRTTDTFDRDRRTLD